MRALRAATGLQAVLGAGPLGLLQWAPAARRQEVDAYAEGAGLVQQAGPFVAPCVCGAQGSRCALFGRSSCWALRGTVWRSVLQQPVRQGTAWRVIAARRGDKLGATWAASPPSRGVTDGRGGAAGRGAAGASWMTRDG